MDNEIIDQTGMAILYKKMATILGQVKRMPKSGTNSHFNYKFVKDSDVLDTVRELMAEQNLALLPEIINYTVTGKKTQIQMVFTIACGDTGATRSMSWFGEADDGQDKGIGKAATLAEKYFLLKLFMVSTGDPADDPDSGHEERQPRQNRATSPASASNGNGQASHSQTSQNSPSSAPKNGNGMDRDTARQKAIKMLIDAGIDPNAAIKIEPPPNPPTSSNNLDWATRMIERAKAAS